MVCLTCNRKMVIPKGMRGPQCLTCRPVRRNGKLPCSEPRVRRAGTVTQEGVHDYLTRGKPVSNF
jgi:hypothetical protein